METLFGIFIDLSPIGVYFLIEWITSYNNKQKHFESTLYIVSIVIAIIFNLIFLDIYYMLFTIIDSWSRWIYVLMPFLFVIQLISNIKGFINSKKEERLFINTINHIINTQKKESFSTSDLEEATKIPYEGEVVRLFNLFQKNGHIPANITLN